MVGEDDDDMRRQLRAYCDAFDEIERMNAVYFSKRKKLLNELKRTEVGLLRCMDDEQVNCFETVQVSESKRRYNVWVTRETAATQAKDKKTTKLKKLNRDMLLFELSRVPIEKLQSNQMSAPSKSLSQAITEHLSSVGTNRRGSSADGCNDEPRPSDAVQYKLKLHKRRTAPTATVDKDKANNKPSLRLVELANTYIACKGEKTTLKLEEKQQKEVPYNTCMQLAPLVEEYIIEQGGEVSFDNLVVHITQDKEVHHKKKGASDDVPMDLFVDAVKTVLLKQQLRDEVSDESLTFVKDQRTLFEIQSIIDENLQKQRATDKGDCDGDDAHTDFEANEKKECIRAMGRINISKRTTT